MKSSSRTAAVLAQALGALALVLVFAIHSDRAAGQAASQAQASAYVPPPRSISDITAILDSEKPDAAKYGRYLALVDQKPPAGASGEDLGRFYLARAQAASQLGRVEQWVADATQARQFAAAANDVNTRDQALNELSQAQSQLGNYTAAIDYAQQLVNTAGRFVGQAVGAHARLAGAYAFSGKLQEAHAEADAAMNAYNQLTALKRVDQTTLISGRGSVMLAAGTVFEAEGRYADAERQYAMATADSETVLQNYDSWQNPHKASREVIQSVLASRRIRLAAVIVQQGRLAEGESLARKALLDSLRQQGRYAPTTAFIVGYLAYVILNEGRPQDAHRLSVAAVDIYNRIGGTTGGRAVTNARLGVANALAAMGDWRGAMAAYDEARRFIGPDEKLAQVLFNNNLTRIIAELKNNRANEALSQVTVIAQNRERNLGGSNPNTLEAQGLQAAALYYAGRRNEALATFRTAVPKLIQGSRVSDSGEGSAVLHDMLLRFVLETYIGLLSETKAAGSAEEAFAVADVVRGQAVQRALSESAARTNVRDPALADLVRREQDDQTQVKALFALLSSIQAAPADQRDDKTVAALRKQIDDIRGARAKLRQDIEKRFPDYANLIDPRPVTVDQARAKLRPDEALVTLYVGDTQSFVWAVPASGPVAFAAAPLPAAKIAQEVRTLRKALEPNASSLSDIPAFDVERAYALYAALLAPVEPGWHNAKALLVVPHGALGQLPLSLLPTAPGKLEAKGALPFAEYKKVPWLVRRVAITQLPSATALVTLRSLPAGNAQRRAFVGFGDPWFNETEAREAQSQGSGGGTVIASRGGTGKGLRIVLRAAPATENASTAKVTDLPRLPETADEVRGVAAALKADPNSDIFLGAKANEETVRTTNLANRRVVMFATHGLVPGDLDGLQEPALALTAPAVAHIQGDGLLTMSKILGLKLDADWVVLSACNTAAGDGAGAEAVSGLGRAFFYAGSRALLVSNWPVETTSARALTTDLFRRQAEQPGLARAEALRQAELALIDGDGFIADGKPLFSYAHPIFWAPFIVIGDGGGGSGS